MNKTINMELTEAQVKSIKYILEGDLSEYKSQLQSAKKSAKIAFITSGIYAIEKLLESLE